MDRKQQVKPVAVRLIVVIWMSLALMSCGSGQVAEPAQAPGSQDLVLDAKSPLAVEGAELLIVLATNDTRLYDSGPFVIQHAADVTILHVEGRLVSGNLNLAAFGAGISLTDENGDPCALVSSGTEEPFWEFMVPATSRSFTLHLPDGQLVSLDSILQLVP